MIGKKAIQKQLYIALREAISQISSKEQAIDCMIQISQCEKEHCISGLQVEYLKTLCQMRINELEDMEGQHGTF